jgi:hypothetical protein
MGGMGTHLQWSIHAFVGGAKKQVLCENIYLKWPLIPIYVTFCMGLSVCSNSANAL